jgi:hypothetical protein
MRPVCRRIELPPNDEKPRTGVADAEEEVEPQA